MLARRPDPGDRRAIWLELTPLGLSHIERVHQLEQEISARFFEPLDTEQRRQLAVILTILSEHARFQTDQRCNPLDLARGDSATKHRRLRGHDRRLAEDQSLR